MLTLYPRGGIYCNLGPSAQAVAGILNNRATGCGASGQAKGCPGFDHIYLGVGTDNEPARDLYVRLGYRPIGESTSITYDYIDDDGPTRTATEMSDYYRKPLL